MPLLASHLQKNWRLTKLDQLKKKCNSVSYKQQTGTHTAIYLTVKEYLWFPQEHVVMPVYYAAVPWWGCTACRPQCRSPFIVFIEPGRLLLTHTPTLTHIHTHSHTVQFGFRLKMCPTFDVILILCMPHQHKFIHTEFTHDHAHSHIYCALIDLWRHSKTNSIM